MSRVCVFVKMLSLFEFMILIATSWFEAVVERSIFTATSSPTEYVFLSVESGPEVGVVLPFDL